MLLSCCIFLDVPLSSRLDELELENKNMNKGQWENQSCQTVFQDLPRVVMFP